MAIRIVEKVLFISDLLFPLWLIAFMIVLKKKGVKTWKAWGISSTFCTIQAYIVAKTTGWNLGGYLVILVASLPSIILGNDKVPDNVTSVLFWIMPPLVFVIIPMLVLYLLSKRKASRRNLS